MYSKQTVYDAHLGSKKHVKAAAARGSSSAPTPSAETPSNGTSSKPQESRNKRLARLSHVSTVLLTPLVTTLSETKSNVERRFALTAREREQEMLDQSNAATQTSGDPDAAAPAEEEAEEEKIYNPLKLPLGWDGKPIPYWLYKLHGLGVEYRCEICSDHVYMGRKNFDRHFQVRTS